MKTDTAAVGGFFEDLPVLMFVLAGVLLIVSSYVWTCHVIAYEDSQEALDACAERLLNEVLARVDDKAASHGHPLLSGLQFLNLSAYAERLLGERMGWAIAFSVLHPGPSKTLVSETKSTHIENPSTTGYAHSLVNAVSDEGVTCVVEVRVVVW